MDDVLEFIDWRFKAGDEVVFSAAKFNQYMNQIYPGSSLSTGEDFRCRIVDRGCGSSGERYYTVDFNSLLTELHKGVVDEVFDAVTSAWEVDDGLPETLNFILSEDVKIQLRSPSSCDHDMKVYDSGWTKERFCTKCTYKEVL